VHIEAVTVNPAQGFESALKDPLPGRPLAATGATPGVSGGRATDRRIWRHQRRWL